MICRSHPWGALLLAFALCALAACGGGASTKKADPPHTAKAPERLPIASDIKPEPGGSNQSGPVIARVGSTPITRSALESRIAIEAHSEESPTPVPVPPSFTACVAQLAVAGSGAKSSAAELTLRCRQRYEALVSKVLSSLITADRVIDQAAAEGVGPTDQEVRQRVERLKATQYGSEAGFKAFLARTGENLPDVLFNIQEQMATTALFDKVHASVPRITPQLVARYYATHKQNYAVAEQRDLGIVHTKSPSLARRVKRELQAGTSFKRARASVPDTQPVGAKEGLAKGLEPHFYAERPLNDAIFAAPLNKVRGPFRLDLFPHGVHFPKARGDIQDVDGYYVFEIFAIRPAHIKPLSQVKAELTKSLPETLYNESLTAYISRYRAKWKSKTNCADGYVVGKCRQFHGEPAEDPYTFS